MNDNIPTMGETIDEMVEDGKIVYKAWLGREDSDPAAMALLSARNKLFMAEQTILKLKKWIAEEEKKAAKKAEREAEKALLENAEIQINLEDVRSVYSGRVGCMCGCNGNYRYASKYQKEQGERRGYDVGDDEVSDRSVKIMVNKMNKLLATLPEEDFIFGLNEGFGRDYIYYEDNGRCICVYMN